MKLKITLIRSGMTALGKEGRYLGLMDEALDREGIAQIQRNQQAGLYPEAARVYTSEQRRSRETASLIYPHIPAIVLRELHAFGYGAYEGLTYQEVISDKQFPTWSDSEELIAFPGGESPHGFTARCLIGFHRLTEELAGNGIETAAVITHKSVIETILKRYYLPRYTYRYWDIPYGGGFTITYDSSLSMAKIQNSF